MENMLRIAGVIKESIVDGPGLRYTIFTQGCKHHCKGCHNPQTHDLLGGRLVSIEKVYESILENPLLSGVTYSGGEPFLQPEPLYYLSVKLKERNKNIYCYTGFTFEELLTLAQGDPFIDKLLGQIDVLIDGRYLEKERDLTLKFRGSRNQRILNLPKSLELKQAVLLDI